MILFDAHVHIHDCFNLDRMFNAAFRNFLSIAESRQSREETAAFLLLTEGAGQYRFREMMNHQDSCRHWRVLPTAESISFRLENEGSTGITMFLVAGRQIVTFERLEVLALLSGDEYEDGRPLGQTVARVREHGAVPALPWGAGKWLGRRKRILRRFLEEDTSTIFLADNRSRPLFWRLPDFAGKSGLKILAGTDPLPFRWEEGRAGSFGSILRLDGREIDAHHPAASLKHLLTTAGCRPQVYGRSEAMFGFFRNQAAMQLRKHFSA